MPSNFSRVTRTDPCPICGRGDWCLVKLDKSAVICARVESPRKIERHGKDAAGWLHQLADDGFQPMARTITFGTDRSADAKPDFSRLAAKYQAAVKPNHLAGFASSMGLSVEALRRLGIGWAASSCAWAFPMADATGKYIGIRLRTAAGNKLSVRGSTTGLFLPMGLSPTSDFLLICEGPTDTAALLDLDFAAVGRPSCSGGVGLLVQYARRTRPSEVVIVSDVDPHGAGQRGAASLADALLTLVAGVRIVAPPDGVKDARAWKQAGATRDDVLAAIAAAPVRRLQLQFHEVLA